MCAACKICFSLRNQTQELLQKAEQNPVKSEEEKVVMSPSPV